MLPLYWQCYQKYTKGTGCSTPWKHTARHKFCVNTLLLDKRTFAQNFKFCFISFQELKQQIAFVYSCVSLPQHALNLRRVNFAQKLQIVIIVSHKNILHTPPSLLVFPLFHLNPNLFFLLLATPYSSPHILDTLVLIISIFLSHSFQIIQQKPTSRSLYMGTGIHLVCNSSQ